MIDIHIEKEQVELVKGLLGILVVIVPSFSVFLVWVIRRVDFGGRERAKEYADKNRLLIEETKETISLMQIHIDSFEKVQAVYLSQIEQYKLENKDLRDKLQNLQKEFSELKMEMKILREHDEARAKQILNNALKLLLNLGYSEHLGNLYVLYLEGKIEVEEIAREIKIERDKFNLPNLDLYKENE